jgi:hypothetical protein
VFLFQLLLSEEYCFLVLLTILILFRAKMLSLLMDYPVSVVRLLGLEEDLLLSF